MTPRKFLGGAILTAIFVGLFVVFAFEKGTDNAAIAIALALATTWLLVKGMNLWVNE